MSVILFSSIIIGFLFLSLLVKYKIMFVELWKKIDRKKDMESLPGKGSLYFLIGSFLAFLLFSDRKSTRLNSSHIPLSRMPSSA